MAIDEGSLSELNLWDGFTGEPSRVRNVHLVYQDGQPLFQQAHRASGMIMIEFGNWDGEEGTVVAVTFVVELINRPAGWQAEVVFQADRAPLEVSKPFREQIVTIQRMLDEINAAILNGQTCNLAPYVEGWGRWDEHFRITVFTPPNITKPPNVGESRYGVNPKTMDDPDAPMLTQAQFNLVCFVLWSGIVCFALFSPAVIRIWQGFFTLPVSGVQMIGVFSSLLLIGWGVVQLKKRKADRGQRSADTE
jgi:hypothetical protein